MDFEFENKEDLTEQIETTDMENDEFVDISSSSEEEIDIMSSSNPVPKKKERNVKRIVINSVTSAILVICILLTSLFTIYKVL